MRFIKGLIGVVAVAAAASVGFAAMAAETTPERLRNAANEPQNWLMNLGTYNGWHYSKLSQINKSNVGNLRVKFMASIGGNMLCTTPNWCRGNENASPLVEDGFMYVPDSHNKVMKFDVRSGARAYPLWRFDPVTERPGGVYSGKASRGIALFRDNIIIATIDARLVAVGKDSGEAVYDVSGVEPAGGINEPEFTATRVFRSVPTAMTTAGGQDLITVASTGMGITWLGGFDAANGENLWRTSFIPQPGEPNFGTWPGETWKWGGVSAWGATTFDYASNTIFIGTGEPSPAYDPEFRPGDNLYSTSTDALDADSGVMKWFFQHTPNDQWDFDSTGTRMIFDVTGPDGKAHQAVTQWDRNGFTYTLDAETGSFLQAVAQVDNINWTLGLDPKSGKPIEYVAGGNILQPYNVAGPRRGRSEEDAPLVCATWGGGPTGIWPPSYDPNRHMTYNTRTSGCTYQTVVKSVEEGPFDPLRRESLGSVTRQVQVNTMANVISIDIESGKVANTYTRDLGIPGTRQAEVGALATGGGVVFSGFDDGTLLALDSDHLSVLWEFNTGTSMKSAPMSFAVGGNQYIGVIAGGDNPGRASRGGGISTMILPTAVLLVFGL